MDLFDNLKTPYYMIDKKELDYGLNKLKAALIKAWPNYIIGYSIHYYYYYY